MSRLGEIIEPALSSAREHLKGAEHAPAMPGEELNAAFGALSACLDYLVLHGPPTHEVYDPRELLETHRDSLAFSRHSLETEVVKECVGDREQILVALRALIGCCELYEDALLNIDLYEEGKDVYIGLTLDGPGRFGQMTFVGGLLPLPMDSLSELWTSATRGGRLDRTPNGLTLRLGGVREPSEPESGLEPLLGAVTDARKRVRLAMAAVDSNQGLKDAPSDARGAVDAALAIVDEDVRMEPADLIVAVSEVEHRLAPELEAHSIVLDILSDRGGPPIRMFRKRIVSLLESALRHAMRVLPRGGGVSSLIDYDKQARAAGIVVAIEGAEYVHCETIYTASMRRSAVELHGGTFNVADDPSGVTLTISLPDPVGRVLDEWLPGWELFSDRCGQMLRLLKSGGQVPPEEFILAGVLEEELERWLLPRLVEAPAVNLAHDMKPDTAPAPGGSPERREKALGQIRRGKPRKEIAKPQYAAEILWAYRQDARHSQAIGAQALGEQELKDLCSELVKSPPDCAACLRLVARALGFQS